MGLKLNAHAVICSLVLVLLLGTVLPSSAQSCSVQALSYCLPAYQGGPVTPPCCSALRSQVPCFCYYASNPSYRSIIYSGAGQKIGNACGLRYPRC